jgi:Putative auto-transporter adhesin, head GIN domain
VTITLPSLSRVKVEGAGQTIITGVASDRLDLSYMGAGQLTATGKVKYLRLNAKGVGEVDTKGLHAERVDVNFNGVGNVSVYATDTVNAVAKGMGSLAYYGKPKTVNKQVSGIGNVGPGD